MRLLLVLGLALLSGAVQAKECGDQASQAALNECAGQAYRGSDAALNAAYREIRARLADDAAGRARLQTAQRTWLAFRDAECAFATAASADGSIHPYLQATCLEALTAARLDQLQAYLACEEGDLSCPVPAR